MNQPSRSFAHLVARLSDASVKRRWEAYRDVGWDEPGYAIDADDPRWVLPTWEPLGGSDWYLGQTEPVRSHLGLLRLLVLLKVGVEFESVLQQGLLAVASELPDGDPAFRYLYHELTEEAQHSMMFQEVINRSAVRVPRSSDQMRAVFGTLAADAKGDWSTLFLSALAGEEVFDRLQRRLLTHSSLHPLLRRVFEIHVAEETRHLAFARAYLRECVPRLDPDQSRLLRYRAPYVVEWTARQILVPQSLSDALVNDWAMPDEMRRSLQDDQIATDLRRSCTGDLVRLCQELELVDPRLASIWSNLQAASPSVTEMAP